MKKFMKGSRVTRSSETWPVVYIDFMTNLMIFFVILWSISQGKKVEITATGDTTARMVSLPGDVLFPAGKTALSGEGKSVFKKLFTDESGAVLNFENNALMKRLLVIHGHTDGDGRKADNLSLGFHRALASYSEIMSYSKELPDHLVLCTHADNSPAREVPPMKGKLTPEQKKALSAAKSKNRRITIEDKLVSQIEEEM
jgi:flagellar motor protein MotB